MPRSPLALPSPPHTVEPPTISPPPYMAAFKQPNLKFFSLAKYHSGIAGEKDKVVCVVRTKLLIASIRGAVTQEVLLSTIVSIHYQDRSDPLPSHGGAEERCGTSSSEVCVVPFTDLVLTDADGKQCAFSIPKAQVPQFLKVALCYCVSGVSAHEITGRVPLVESMLGEKKQSHLLSSFVTMVQHAGQEGREDDERRVKRLLAESSRSAFDVSRQPDSWLPRNLSDIAESKMNDDEISDELPLLESSVVLPPPGQDSDDGHGKRELHADATVEAFGRSMERLKLHRDPNADGNSAAADGGHPWRSKVDQEVGLSDGMEPIFGPGGTIRFRMSRAMPQPSDQMLNEVRDLRRELELLKLEARSGLLPTTTTHRPAARSSSVDTDAGGVDVKPSGRPDSNVALLDASSIAAVDAMVDRERPVAAVKPPEENRGSAVTLLPLLTAASQEVALKSLDELAELQRFILDTSRRHAHPTIWQHVERMSEPLRVLYHLLAPRSQTLVDRAPGAVGPSGMLRGEYLPVWVLVDYGEVDYECTPPVLRQYHRVMARKVDEEGASHVMIATREQFAVDGGYTLIAFSSIDDIALGAQPRPVSVQRSMLDGSVNRADEYISSATCLSIKTRLQHILIQFETPRECTMWLQLLQDAVVVNTRRHPTGRVTDLIKLPTAMTDDFPELRRAPAPDVPDVPLPPQIAPEDL